MVRRYQFKTNLSRLSLTTLLLTVTLLVFGVLFVYNASVIEGFKDFGDKFHFAKQQLTWSIIGFIFLFIASKIPLNLIKRLSPYFFGLCLLLMIAVLIPGIGLKLQGARRWINLFGFSLQPSEMTKLGLVLHLSSWLSTPRKLSHFLFVLVSVVTLTMLQPDLGTAIIIASLGFLLYYFSGSPWYQIFSIAGIGVLAVSLLILSSPYRRERLATYFDPTSDPLGRSYHINQVLLALGSGGFWGVGLGRSRQKFAYLPEATTDSIFAVIAEELGFFGALVLIALFLGLILVGLHIAQKSKDKYHQLLAGGAIGLIAIQAILNLSAMVALVPLTGVPLPLISYGGSSLISLLTAIGLLINVANSQKL